MAPRPPRQAGGRGCAPVHTTTKPDDFRSLGHGWHQGVPAAEKGAALPDSTHLLANSAHGRTYRPRDRVSTLDGPPRPAAAAAAGYALGRRNSRRCWLPTGRDIPPVVRVR